MRISDRRLTLAAYFGMAAGLTAAGFAIATGSGLLSAASVLLTGGASLVPDIVALRQSRRIDASSDRRLSPVISPEIRQSIEPEPAPRELDWRFGQPEAGRPTIH